MKRGKIFLAAIFFATCINPAVDNNALSIKQKSIVTIAALAAKGNLQKLKLALNQGLDAGLSINEIKEMLIQLYAYCGFPRSLNAINTFSAVLTERKAKEIEDSIGVEPAIIGDGMNKYEIGKSNLGKLTGRVETTPTASYAILVPVIDIFLKEHLFADIFSRGVLTNAERELTTISALCALGGVESQLQAHMSISMKLGISEEQIKNMLAIIEGYIGKAGAAACMQVLAKAVVGKQAN